MKNFRLKSQSEREKQQRERDRERERGKRDASNGSLESGILAFKLFVTIKRLMVMVLAIDRVS